MKKHLLSSFFLVFICLQFTVAQPIEVNKYVLSPFGSPVSSIDWVGTVKDGSNNLITVGNTIISQDITALLISKQNSSGTQVWQAAFHPSTTSISSSYGIAVTLDANNNIYVVGVTKIGTTGFFDYVVLKYSSSGSLLWNKIIDADGLDDLPTAIGLNNDGNLFITGSSTSISSLTDYFTLRLNPTTGVEVWRKTYDYNYQFDGAVKLSFDALGNPTIFGFSGTTLGSFSLASVKYNKSTGAVIADNHTATGISVVNPKAFIKDQWDNYYIAGEITATSQNISLLKFDANLQFKWNVTYDFQNEGESVKALATDENGNVILTGSSKVNNNLTDLLIVKFDSSGTVLWQQKRYADRQQATLVGKQIVVLPDNSMYILGERNYQGNHKIILVYLNGDGIFLHENRHPSDCFESDEYPVRMEFFPTLNRMIVLGKNHKTPNEFQYYDLRYDYLFRDPAIEYDSLDQPLCKKSEIIVKFSKTYVKQESVNNLDISYGILADFLTIDAVNAISNTLPFGRNTQMIRIFPNI